MKRARLTEAGREWFNEVHERTGKDLPWELDEVMNAVIDPSDMGWIVEGKDHRLVMLTNDMMEEVE